MLSAIFLFRESEKNHDESQGGVSQARGIEFSLWLSRWAMSTDEGIEQKQRVRVDMKQRNDARIIAGEVAEAMGEPQLPISPRETGIPVRCQLLRTQLLHWQ